MEENQTPEVGRFVIFHDSKNQPHDALITTVWGPTCVNVVFVSGDEARQDAFGRQIERQTSVSSMAATSAPGNYWRFPNESPRTYEPPAQS